MGHICDGGNWDSPWGVWVVTDMSINQWEGTEVENCSHGK